MAGFYADHFSVNQLCDEGAYLVSVAVFTFAARGRWSKALSSFLLRTLTRQSGLGFEPGSHGEHWQATFVVEDGFGHGPQNPLPAVCRPTQPDT